MRIREQDGRNVLVLSGAAAFYERMNLEVIENLQRDIQNERDKRRRIGEIYAIYQALAKTWYERNVIATRGLLCWFQCEGFDVYARELLPAGIKPFRGTDEELAIYHQKLDEGEEPCFFHPEDIVVDLEDVDRTPCPVCGVDKYPIVKSLEYFSGESEPFVTKMVVPCENCFKVQPLIEPFRSK